MSKAALLIQIITALETARDEATAAATQAKATATDKENIAENRYDTLGLEAAYLAHGQSNRVMELEADLNAYRNLANQVVNDPKTAKIGTIVTLEDENESLTHVFLGPGAGGMKFNLDETEIIVVTPSSPLGNALIGQHVDDEIALNGKSPRFTVTAIS